MAPIFTLSAAKATPPEEGFSACGRMSPGFEMSQQKIKVG
jgi:hypothetical protein